MTRKHLRQAREKAGLSQESLAHAVGTTHQTYHSAERGHRGLRLDLALAIASDHLQSVADRNVAALHQLATRIAPSEVRVMVFAHSAVSDKGPAALAAVTR